MTWNLLCALVHSQIVPFTGTKGPNPTPEKQPHTITPPPLNFTLGTMQSGNACADPAL